MTPFLFVLCILLAVVMTWQTAEGRLTRTVAGFSEQSATLQQRCASLERTLRNAFEYNRGQQGRIERAKETIQRVTDASRKDREAFGKRLEQQAQVIMRYQFLTDTGTPDELAANLLDGTRRLVAEIGFVQEVAPCGHTVGAEKAVIEDVRWIEKPKEYLAADAAYTKRMQKEAAKQATR